MIQLERVCKFFGKSSEVIKALDQVSLTVKAGEFLIVKGRSGSGKTTLLNVLSGLDSVTSGTILVQNQSLTTLSDRKLSIFRNRSIGYVFQSFYLEASKTVLHNVTLPLLFTGISKQERIERACTLLERVGLKDKIYQKAGKLSAGQRQRVALSRALVNQPQLILADEPTANLDQETGDTIMNLLKELRNQGHTLILVSHDPQLEIERSRTLQMQDGKIVSESTNL
jgi:putative ABC transport system ATP-binding protein